MALQFRIIFVILKQWLLECFGLPILSIMIAIPIVRKYTMEERSKLFQKDKFFRDRSSVFATWHQLMIFKQDVRFVEKDTFSNVFVKRVK